MKSEIKLLVLEDVEEDFKLIERTLKKANLQFDAKVVDTKEGYIEALHHYQADLILSDHSLPQFNSTEALAILKDKGVSIPFIIVTGNVSEEFAVNCIKQGVDDYILKSNLEKLPSAISNALEKKESERAYANSLIELEEHNRMLLKYNKELESFVHNITHNLRTPLSSMLDLLSMMKTQGQNPDEVLRSYFSMMEDSIQKLDETLKELQDNSQHSKTKLNITHVDLAALIEDQADRMKFMPGAESIEKEIRIDEKEGFYCDGYHVSVIASNLISNAIKYHDAKKKNPFIKISAVVTSKKVLLEFHDNGIGIDEQYLENIFDMFFRATVKNEGAGLGLHIVKESVDKLKGNITAESRLGYGTVFTIMLPNYRPAVSSHDYNKIREEKQLNKKSAPAISNNKFQFNP